MGGVLVHIKGFNYTQFHIKVMCSPKTWGQYALDILGRTLEAYCWVHDAT